MLFQLLGQLKLFLDGKTSASELADWLADNMSDVLDSRDSAAESLLSEVDADLVWLQEQLIAPEQFRYRMQLLYQAYDRDASASHTNQFATWRPDGPIGLMGPAADIRTAAAALPPIRIWAGSPIAGGTSPAEERELVFSR